MYICSETKLGQTSGDATKIANESEKCKATTSSSQWILLYTKNTQE